MKEILVARHRPTNRSQRKKLEKEAISNSQPFVDIEKDFINMLFGLMPFTKTTYNDVYQEFQLHWMDNIQWHDYNQKFRLTKLNEHYFEENYKPLEVHKTECFIDRALRGIRDRAGQREDAKQIEV